MRTRHLVVMGASARGIEALREIVAKLPEDFAAPVCIVRHTSPQSPGVVDAILSRAGRLKACDAHASPHVSGGAIDSGVVHQHGR